MIKLYALVIFLCFTSVLSAQFEPFAVGETFDFTESPIRSYAFDSDGDMDLDILVGNDQDLVLFENNSDKGYYSYAKRIQWFNPLNDLFMDADIDQDGDLDLLIISLNAGRVLLAENLGDNNFGDYVMLVNEQEAFNEIKLEDLNGDNYPEIIVSYIDGLAIKWYENLQDNSLGPASDIEGPTQNNGVLEILDMDKDGDMDILHANRVSGSILLFRNDGIANFSNEELIASPNTDIVDLQKIDIDNDADMDLFLHSAINKEIILFENVNGTLQEIQRMQYTDATLGLFVFDIGKDGDLDIVSKELSQLVYFENSGNGGFEQETLLNNIFNLNIGSMDIYDLDNDGNLDGIELEECAIDPVIDREECPIVVHSKILEIAHAEIDINTQSCYYPFRIATKDLNQDGYDDIAVSSFLNRNIVIYINKATDKGYNLSQALNLSRGFIQRLELLDMDEDGLTDVFVCTSNVIGWYPNLGNGCFGDFVIIDEIQTARRVAVKDFTGDGLKDIVVSVQSSDNILFLKNVSNNTFADPVEIAIGSSSKILGAADLDNDGDQDVIVLFASDSSINWIENINGFEETKSHFISDGSELSERTVNLVDLDKDGDIDFLALHGSSFGWYENLAEGVFAEEFTGIGEATGFTQSTIVADLDGNGLLDLISSTNDDPISNVNYFLNGDNGNFSEETVAAPFDGGLQELTVSDFDNDGDQDIVLAGGTTYEIYILENVGALSNTKHTLEAPLFEVYPNPTLETIFIRSEKEIDRVELLSIDGKKIRTYMNSANIKLSNHDASVYILKVFFKDGSYQTQKIVKI